VTEPERAAQAADMKRSLTIDARIAVIGDISPAKALEELFICINPLTLWG
jgi:hypothetical protein